MNAHKYLLPFPPLSHARMLMFSPETTDVNKYSMKIVVLILDLKHPNHLSSRRLFVKLTYFHHCV